MKWKRRLRRGLCSALTVGLCLGFSLATGSTAMPDVRTSGQLPTLTMLSTTQEYQALAAKEITPWDVASVNAKLESWGEERYGGRWRDDNGVLHVNILDQADAADFEGQPVVLHLCSYSVAELRSYVQSAFDACEGTLTVGIGVSNKNNVLEIFVEEGVTREEVSALVRRTALKDMPVKFLFPGDEGYIGVIKDYEPSWTPAQAEAARKKAAQNQTAASAPQAGTLAALSSQTPLVMGKGIHHEDYGGQPNSLAFFVRDNGAGYRYGYVTAGHGVAAGDTMYYNSALSMPLGVCTKSYSRQDGYTADCAFVALNQDYDGTRTFFQNNTSVYANGGYCSGSFDEGMNYTMVGCGGGLYHTVSGTCFYEQYYLTYTNYPVGLFTYTSQPGDSGGVIFNQGPSTSGWYQTAGMNLGAKTVNGTTYALGITVAQICNQLGVTMINDSACKGDVNEDGNVSISDVRQALRCANGQITLTGTPFMRADMNCDGNVTQEDANALLDVVSG